MPLEHSYAIPVLTDRARAELDSIIAEMNAADGGDRQRWQWLADTVLPERMLELYLETYTSRAGHRVKLVPLVTGGARPEKEAEAMAWLVERGYHEPRLRRRQGRGSPAVTQFLAKISWRTGVEVPGDLFAIALRVVARMK